MLRILVPFLLCQLTEPKYLHVFVMGLISTAFIEEFYIISSVNVGIELRLQETLNEKVVNFFI